eukprot:5524511-Alexandrium_andersonii.AAC.1
MSASLVGSEMCIRDRLWAVPRATAPARPIVGGPLAGPSGRLARRDRRRADWVGSAARRRRLPPHRPILESADS